MAPSTGVTTRMRRQQGDGGINGTGSQVHKVGQGTPKCGLVGCAVLTHGATGDEWELGNLGVSREVRAQKQELFV